ncbi:MAG: hypothetical protein JWM37_86 [Candidatus Saccharibacteria bacterium]|nr:hypothetical protein [Candidatus Saccharibacteria bacterium]
MNRMFKIGLIAFLGIGVTVGVVAWHARTPAAGQHAVSATAKSGHGNIRLIATGDMLPHDTVNQAAHRQDGSYDYLPLFDQVKPYLTSGDIRFCNQESPSAGSFGVSGYPTFNAPPQFAKDLSSLGCNVINLANNHANDKEQSGIDQTRGLWNQLHPLAVAGTNRSADEQNQIATFKAGGLTFAFLSYAECSNDTYLTDYGVNILSKDLASRQIAAAKQSADIIIVGTHWCNENTDVPDATQQDWAKYLADQGVTVVIGTGPHYLQPVSRLNRAGGGQTVVWYSLGNFLSTQEDIEGLIGGIAVMDIDPSTKAVTGVGFMPTYMHYEWTAEQKANENYLARKNLKIYPLDQAEAALARSQNHTTVDAQTQRVTALMNRYTSTTMLTSNTALSR